MGGWSRIGRANVYTRKRPNVQCREGVASRMFAGELRAQPALDCTVGWLKLQDLDLTLNRAAKLIPSTYVFRPLSNDFAVLAQ